MSIKVLYPPPPKKKLYLPKTNFWLRPCCTQKTFLQITPLVSIQNQNEPEAHTSDAKTNPNGPYPPLCITLRLSWVPWVLLWSELLKTKGIVVGQLSSCSCSISIGRVPASTTSSKTFLAIIYCQSTTSNNNNNNNNNQSNINSTSNECGIWSAINSQLSNMRLQWLSGDALKLRIYIIGLRLI